MTRPPDFDELVGEDLSLQERDRLRNVHDLLVQAGPPPELAPHLEHGPTLGMTLGGGAGQRRRGLMLLAAALVVLALAFLGGYIAGNRGGGLAAAEVHRLVGTRLAPRANASLRVEHVDAAGNWPMTIAETGLPKLPAHAYYEVFLVRNGHIWASCGTFITSGKDAATEVRLNAPYRLRRSDSWVVTRQLHGDRTAGPVVLRPLA
jgi:hypothetical protein